MVKNVREEDELILYISYATAYPIYNRLFKDGKIKTGYQMQKFNSNLITGLSNYDKVISLSVLPYAQVKADRIEEDIEGIKYIGIRNCVGAIHKFSNPTFLYIEGTRIIKKYKPDYIVCDAIATSPCIISKLLGKRFHIPVVGIITDLPGMCVSTNKTISKNVRRMQGFDAYILLTEQMNEVVNPLGKPYMVMEGLCSSTIPELREKNKKRILMYAGSLWEHDAGIEYFVNGFIKANLDNAELHLYGTGTLVPWIEEISKKYPAVKYMGCVTNDEIVKLQCEATLLVNPRPSDEEFCKYSFPSKTIEYMLSGTPVLMTRLPGVPKEYLEHVYTIDEENEDAVFETLKTIFNKDNDELVEFGLSGRNFVLTNKNCFRQCEKIHVFLRNA